jgi:SPP1 family predicted phage head-tail adaptor
MIGRLNERITIQEATLSDDGIGGKTKAWADLDCNPKVWAKVFVKSGGEGMQEGRMNATSMHEFTIRTRHDVNETMRIVWRGENYNIRLMKRSGNHPQYMIAEAERGV